MQAEQLAQICNGRWQGPQPTTAISDFVTDGRHCQPGSCFIALPGQRFDGHDYLQQAKDAAAGVALVQYYQADIDLPQCVVADTYAALAAVAAAYREQHPVPLVAITGSCGKTSTRAMCESIMALHASVLASKASFNNHIGVPLTLLKLQPEHTHVVQEVGANHAGEIAAIVQWLKPEVAVITNAAPCHLEGFGSLAGVVEAKGEILAGPGVAVLNADDPYFLEWQQRAERQQRQVISFGLSAAAQVRATAIKVVAASTHFTLHIGEASIPMCLQALGEHQVYNALAACAIAYAWQVPLATMQAGIKSFQPVESRMTISTGFAGAKIIDDSYNANPRAMQVALQVLLAQPGEKIMVIADMLELGADSLSYHADFGKHAKAQGLATLYAVGDASQAAVASFGAGAMHFSTHEQLLQALRDRCHPDAVILLKASNSMGLQAVASSLSTTDS